MTDPVFIQPSAVQPNLSGEFIPMTDVGQSIVTSFKETFYAYNNRKEESNRTAQKHLGPSEIGTPCDRRLAMSLLGLPPVNPGGDGWAAWVGTQIHAGVADIFQWASADSGRYAVETPIKFASVLVPRGTGDLLDRVAMVLIDWKCQGEWSRNRLKTYGPSETYRVQAHAYGAGLYRRGEKVRHVAIVSLPREASSLDDMYAWTEPLDLKLADAAMKRVEQLDRKLKGLTRIGLSPVEAAHAAPIDASECRFCSFHLKRSKSLSEGCSGKPEQPS